MVKTTASCISNNAGVVLVDPNAPTVDAGINQTHCQGTAVILVATNPNGATITWDHGVVNGTAFTPVVGSVKYTATATLNGCTSSDTVLVTINKVPVVDAGNDQTHCEGASVTLTATNPDAAVITWNRGVTNNTAFTPAVGALVYRATATLNACVASDSVRVTINKKPVVDAGNNQNVCEGTPVTLTASNPDAATLTWSNGVSNGTAFTPAVGNVLYTVSANLNNCITTDTVRVRVSANPVITVAKTDPTTCGTATGRITISGLTANTTYRVSYNAVVDASFTSNANGQIIISNLRAGSYNNIIVKTTAGCTDTDAGVNLADPNAPMVDAGPNQTHCSGTDVTLKATNPNSAIITWNRNVKDGIAFTPAIGSLVYTVTANKAGCISSDTVRVTINRTPIVDAGANRNVCEGTPVTLTATNPNAAVITWSNGVSNGTSFVPAVGNVLYTATATLATCVKTDTVRIIVAPKPVLTASNVEICRGLSTTLSTNISNATGNVAYTWSPSTGLSGTTTASVTARPTASTSYRIIATDAKGCKDTATAVLTVNSKPVLTATTGDICEGTSTPLSTTVSGATGTVAYAWSPATGLNVTNAAAVTANPTVTTAYLVIATDAKGCKDSANTSVKVTAGPVLNEGADTAVCQNNSLIKLYATGSNFANITWSGGMGTFSNRNSLTPNYTPSPAEIRQDSIVLTLTATSLSNRCANMAKTLKIYMLKTPVVDAGPNGDVCDNAQVILNGTSSTGRAVWSTKQQGAFIDTVIKLQNRYQPSTAEIASGTVKLYLTSTNNRVCKAVRDSVNYTVIPSPDPIAQDYIEFCNYNNNTLEINAGGGVGMSYLWNTGQTTQKIIVNEEGTYKVTKTARNSCSLLDSVVVVDNCLPKVFLPEAFTPGSNNDNSHMKIFGRNFTNLELVIFNRWGEIIYYTTDKDKPWDGKYRGEYVEPGVYPWVASFEGKFEKNRGPYKIRGSVYVITTKE